MRWVWRTLNIPFVDTPTIKWSVGTRGISARAIVPAGGSSSPAQTGPRKQFFILAFESGGSAQRDYIVCYDPKDVLKKPVNIAKNFKLRGNITSANIDGQTWNYSYPNAAVLDYGLRVAATANYTEKQVIVPRYLTGDEIWAESVPDGIINPQGEKLMDAPLAPAQPIPLIWLDTNEDGRAWAAKADQTT